MLLREVSTQWSRLCWALVPDRTELKLLSDWGAPESGAHLAGLGSCVFQPVLPQRIFLGYPALKAFCPPLGARPGQAAVPPSSQDSQETPVSPHAGWALGGGAGTVHPSEDLQEVWALVPSTALGTVGTQWTPPLT